MIQATAPVIEGWLASGYDLDADILPVLQARTLRKRDSPIRTWAYFTPAIVKCHSQRAALVAKAASAGEPGSIATAGAPISPQDVLQCMAVWINSGRYVPPSAVNNVMRDALLRSGLVTDATLRAHQIY